MGVKAGALVADDASVATSTVLLAAGIGGVIGWIAHTLVTEPDRPERERKLVDAYSQGWRACESYLSRRARARGGPEAPPGSDRGEQPPLRSGP